MATTRRRKSAKRTSQKIVKVKTETKETSPFRWGESYTSLLLGLIVVIIGVLFFVSLVKSHNTKQVTSIATNIATTIPTSLPLHISQTAIPTALKQVTPQSLVTLRPTSLPTKAIPPTAILTPSATPTSTPTVLPTISQSMQNTVTGQRTYIVVAGDDLWHIAEKMYKSGYNYVDIAKANKLENPGLLFSGMKLIIPQITPEIATVSPTVIIQPSQVVMPQQNAAKDSANTYIVQKGDDLWDIAVKEYNDGYKWTAIAKANNLTNPGLIFAGNSLIIPR